jgi:hypothetical protein
MTMANDKRPNRVTTYIGKLLGMLPLLAALSAMFYIGDVRENAADRARPPSKTKPINWTVRDRDQKKMLYAALGFHAATTVCWVVMTIRHRTFAMSRSGWHALFVGCYVAGIGLGALMWYWSPS